MLDNKLTNKRFLVALTLGFFGVTFLYQWASASNYDQYFNGNLTEANDHTSEVTGLSGRPPPIAYDQSDVIILRTPMSNKNSAISNTTKHVILPSAKPSNTKPAIFPVAKPAVAKTAKPAVGPTTAKPSNTKLAIFPVAKPSVAKTAKPAVGPTTAKPGKNLVSKKPQLPPNTCKEPFRTEYITKKNFICCHPLGGLGNHMFVYASSYGIASKLNRTLVISNTTKLLTNAFNLSAKVVHDYKCVVKGSAGKSANLDCGYDASMFTIPKGQNYCVGVYLQSYKYFEHVKEDIKRQFVFRKEQQDKASKIIKDAVASVKATNAKPRVFVGVHIRRGDLVNHKFGYDVATPAYVNRAMTYFRNMYGNVLFVVCTNDLNWSKQTIKSKDVHFVSGNSADVDMAVLVSCNHTISTVGTFGWWAGYLTGGEVIYYHWPSKGGSALRNHFRYDDFFPPDWIGMR